MNLIVCCTENNVIGRGGRMPWHLPRDLRHFRALTLNKTVVMGRHTYAAIGRPLDQRQNIVLSRRPPSDGRVQWAQSLAQARQLAEGEIFIIGGGQLYRESLPQTREIYLTRVHAILDGDCFFPELDSSWQKVAEEQHLADEKNHFSMSFCRYQRREVPLPTEGRFLCM